jgi:hypothetical protein
LHVHDVVVLLQRLLDSADVTVKSPHLIKESLIPVQQVHDVIVLLQRLLDSADVAEAMIRLL